MGVQQVPRGCTHPITTISTTLRRAPRTPASRVPITTHRSTNRSNPCSHTESMAAIRNQWTQDSSIPGRTLYLLTKTCIFYVLNFSILYFFIDLEVKTQHDVRTIPSQNNMTVFYWIVVWILNIFYSKHIDSREWAAVLLSSKALLFFSTIVHISKFDYFWPSEKCLLVCAILTKANGTRFEHQKSGLVKIFELLCSSLPLSKKRTKSIFLDGLWEFCWNSWLKFEAYRLELGRS